MAFRDTKQKARRNLHSKMKVAASYYATPASTPVLIYVRLHSKMQAQGDLKGTNFNYAETEEVVPHILFDRLEVPIPPRNSLVIISADEGWRIGQSEPKDGEFVKAQAVPMSTDDIASRTLPGDL